MTTRSRATENPPSEPQSDEQPAQVPAAPDPSTEAHSAAEGSPGEPEEVARAVQSFVDRHPGSGVYDAVADGRMLPDLAARWDADQRDDKPLTVWEAVAAITRQVDAISKDRTASQGGSYRYRGIDDVFAALHPLLGEHGLLIIPGEVVESRWETRATSSGGTLNVARLRVRYTLVGPDGSTLAGEAWGEGGDAGDKATQKAHSQSYKSFTLQLFSIPTEDSQRDEPDATNPPGRPFGADEIARATAAAQAAEGAATVEALASVRRRALHLLPVPVPLEDGSIAPLTVLFDQRLAQLDRGQGEHS